MAAPSAADAILVPFAVQGMGSEPTLQAAMVPACSATLAASSQFMSCSLSHRVELACADAGLVWRLWWERPRAGPGRALVRGLR